MIILTNAYPTNMPDSEVVSQGGPANFANLFVQHILNLKKKHQWVGVLLERSDSLGAKMEKRYQLPSREYHSLTVHRKIFDAILRSENYDADVNEILCEPISELVAFIKERKPDVVFLNGFGLMNWMLLKAANEARVPVAIQHAGIWTRELDIHKGLYTKQGLRLMKNMEIDSTFYADAEIFLNKWSMDYYHANVMRGPVSNCMIIPLPFNFKNFKRLSSSSAAKQFDFDKDHFNIGMIARWDDIKNHSAVLNIAKLAKAKKMPWVFHSIVSIPDTEKYSKAKKEYQKHINVIPPVDRVGISEFCRSVDLLILPSIFDVSPTVVLEAVASNTPIVISPTVGYVSDFITHGGGKWVVDPSDSKAALRKLAQIKGRQMPDKLKKRIIQAHDHKKVFDAYLRVFMKLKKESQQS